MLPLLLALTVGCGSPAPAPTAPSADALAGSAACAGCHPTQAAAWSASHHGRAEQAVADVAAAFPDPAHPTVTLPDAPGPAAVVGVVGVDPLWQPLVAGPDGRVQVSSRAYDPAERAWFDVFADARAPGDWGHWSGRGMTWNSQCAGCHDTGVRRGYDAEADRYATTVAERGVGCEACHGPSARHVADPTTRTSGPRDREAVAATCEPCHARATPIAEPWRPGVALLDQALPALPGAGADWRPDGGVLAESFEAIAFRASRMHAAGVRCQDCHDVHSAAPKADGDALCATCHADVPEHSRHPVGSDGARCVACHLPVTTYMERDPRHDHAIRVPDPVLDAELGLRSACDRCHDDREASVKAAAAWWPGPRPDRDRTRALAAVQRGAADAPAQVRAALATTTDPFWRAVLLAVSDDVDARLAAAASTDPWLRRAAVTDLPVTERTRPLLIRLLDDPVAAVRLEAASALRTALPPSDPAMATLRRHLVDHADQPGAAFALGAWAAGHGDLVEARRWLGRAVALDPASPEAWRSLAVAEAGAGRPDAALAALDLGLQRSPDAAELRFARALALVPLGRADDVIAELRRVLDLDPTHGRAAYNLGLALHGRHDPEARAWLRRAEGLLPDDPAPPYALATVAAAEGDRAAAQAAAERALARDPAHAGARQVLAWAATR